ncbi:patatin-like phospholipase family protein [Pelotomaculum propionicicum]|uniref:patatin-like phospholipase family protein n=1 Tax=Pelotomaculum propionicicum TaxID=258475 RepID=UPI003B789F2B
MLADGIFEGGGVKAFAMLGALYEAEKRGYNWVNVAGTSAGAIIASFVAAGYTALEIKELVWSLDFKKFRDKDWIGQIPYLGPALRLWFKNGLYKGGFLENWVRKILAAKGIHTFKNLVLKEFENDSKCRYKLVVIATDVSRGRLLRLPHDIKDYNIKPDDLDVASAVRMSANLPFFYEPYTLPYFENKKNKKYSYIIDGGVLSNFPVWIFDGDDTPPWPTFGFKIIEPDSVNPMRIYNPFDLFKATLTTMLEAHDRLYELDPRSMVRTIPITSMGIKTTDFDIIEKQKEDLFISGVNAAESFFASWDFDNFKMRYYQP